MNSKDEERYLSKKIDYDRDIEPYQFVMIHAGVGSGKNRFIDNLVKGGEIEHKDGQHEERFVAPKTVLLITSRRAKVNEQLSSKVAKYDKEMTTIRTSFVSIRRGNLAKHTMQLMEKGLSTHGRWLMGWRNWRRSGFRVLNAKLQSMQAHLMTRGRR